MTVPVPPPCRDFGIEGNRARGSLLRFPSLFKVEEERAFIGEAEMNLWRAVIEKAQDDIARGIEIDSAEQLLSDVKKWAVNRRPSRIYFKR